MLQLRNTITCPHCTGILRVRVLVVSDGNDYEYYLCPRCQDVARRDPRTGEWSLRGQSSQGIPEVVQTLQSLAVDDWRVRSVTRPAGALKIPSSHPGAGSIRKAAKSLTV